MYHLRKAYRLELEKEYEWKAKDYKIVFIDPEKENLDL